MKKIQHIFNYIFYRSYKNEIKKMAGVPKVQAVTMVSLILMLLVLNITLLAEIVLGIQIIGNKNKQSGAIIVVVIEFIVAICVYFFYFHNKKYLKVLKEYDNIEKEIRKKYNLKANLFIIFSIILVITLAIISIQINY